MIDKDSNWATYPVPGGDFLCIYSHASPQYSVRFILLIKAPLGDIQLTIPINTLQPGAVLPIVAGYTSFLGDWGRKIASVRPAWEA